MNKKLSKQNFIASAKQPNFLEQQLYRRPVYESDSPC